MKHCIIVKFKRELSAEEKTALVPEVRELFEHTKAIDGVHDVELLTNCVDRDNRYDWMIVLDMNREALPEYDACEWHHRWKDEYGHLIDKKAIFDYEV